PAAAGQRATPGADPGAQPAPSARVQSADGGEVVERIRVLAPAPRVARSTAALCRASAGGARASRAQRAAGAAPTAGDVRRRALRESRHGVDATQWRGVAERHADPARVGRRAAVCAARLLAALPGAHAERIQHWRRGEPRPGLTLWPGPRAQ